jgi:hypothetical protein
MTVQADRSITAPEAHPVAATRTVVVLDRDLPKGLAANAAAVLALTLGARRPALVGADFEDAAGGAHLGLFPAGLPVLCAGAAELRALREAALERGLLVVDMPAFGQQTNDYAEFRAAVARTAPDRLDYLGMLISGPKKPVRAVTGQLALLR